nr:hypothetical protein Josef01_02j05_57 [uncultured archaeon]
MEADHCRCSECQSHTTIDCIRWRCYCCDLEDMVAVVARTNIEPMLHEQSGIDR